MCLNLHLCRKDCTPEEIQTADNLVQEIVADIDDDGLTEYERDPRCSSSGKGGRCYSLSTTHQDNKDLEAPFKGRKSYGRSLDEHDQTTKKLLEVSSPVLLDILRLNETKHSLTLSVHQFTKHAMP